MTLPSHDESEKLVEDLVAECVSNVETTGDPQIAKVCAQHPNLTSKVTRRMAILKESGLLEDGESARKQRAGIPETLGDFEILAELGGGGMGVVYRAIQKSLGREVALKVIRPEQLFFAGAHERFQREVDAVARLNHPGIVPIYTFGTERGIPYYAMELVSGRSLDAVLDVLFDRGARTAESLSGADLAREIMKDAPSDAHVDVQELGLRLGPSWIQGALRIAHQVADALAHAHERGVIHRDVKPSNILLKRDGSAVLLDFGLATQKGANKLTRTGSALGSPHFIAPEVYAKGGEAADARSDLYSLAVTLYEMLTLRRPFEGSSDDLVARIMTGEYLPLRRANPTIPWDVETVVQKALDVDPSRRYESAAAFARDLKNLLELRPIEAARPSPWLRARRFVQRRPGSAMGLLLAFMLVVVFPMAYSVAMSAKNREIIKERDAAKRERVAAVEQRKLAEARRNAMLGSIDVVLRTFREPAIAEAPGTGPIRIRVLEDTEKLIDALSAEERENPDLMRRVLKVESSIGMISEVVGRNAEALARVQHVTSEARRFSEKYPDQPEFRMLFRDAGRIQAQLLGENGRASEAVPIVDEVLTELRTEYRKHPEDRVIANQYGNALTIAAATHERVGDRATYDSLLNEMTSVYPEFVERFPNDFSLRLEYVARLTEIAFRAAETGEGERALRLLDRARLDMTQGRGRSVDLGLDSGLYLGSCLNLAMGLRLLDRTPEAIEVLASAIADARRMALRFPERWRFRYLLARCLVLHAEYSLADPTNGDLARQELVEAISQLRALHEEQPNTKTFVSDLGAASGTLGDHLQAIKDDAGAIIAYDQSLNSLRALIESDPNGIVDRINSAMTRSQRARVLGRMGRLDEARIDVENARVELERVATEDPEVAEQARPYLAENRLIAATLSLNRNDHGSALGFLERVRELDDDPRMLLEVMRSVSHAIELATSDPSLDDSSRAAAIARYAEFGTRVLKRRLEQIPEVETLCQDATVQALLQTPSCRAAIEH